MVLRRRFLVGFVFTLTSSASGCAIGGETGQNHDALTITDTGVDEAKPIFEASAGDDATTLGDDTGSTPSDAPATTDSTTVFPGPDGCVPSCTTCGAPDGCGGSCATGSCPKAGDVCTGGVCGCTPSCSTCGASDGCGGTCATGACGGAGEKCISGRCIAAPKSYVSPSSYAYAGGWAKAFVVSAQAETSSTIFYTTDGSTPSSSSTSRPNVAEVSLSGGTFKWYADDGVAEAPQSLTVKVDTSLQSYYGFIVDSVRFTSGGGPVLVTTPGATVTGDASYSIWSSPGCPACGLQVVYGVGTDAQGCFYSGSPGSWPGASGRGAFTIKAPAAPGTYHLTVTYTAQFTCADALGTAPLGSRPTADVGWLIVR